jgi:hypothetical protein
LRMACGTDPTRRSCVLCAVRLTDFAGSPPPSGCPGGGQQSRAARREHPPGAVAKLGSDPNSRNWGQTPIPETGV